MAGTPRLSANPGPGRTARAPAPVPGLVGLRAVWARGSRGAPRPGCRGGVAGGAGRAAPSPAPRMTGAREPRREEPPPPPPPSAGLRSRESGARSAGGWERAERGRGAAARPATGPPPRRIGPLYGMWLVTFLLLLDSLHKGETRAGGRAAEAAGPRCARLAARRSARRAPGARGGGWGGGGRTPARGPGWGAAGEGQAPGERPGESPPWSAPPATRACLFGVRPAGRW